MKNSTSTFIFLLLISALGLNSCNSSVKGKWSESDKNQFYKEMAAVDMSNLGENKDMWIDCYYEKAEANFSSFMEANQDEKGCEKIALECTNQILDGGSKKGHWSESDKKKFYAELETVDLSGFGEKKEAWVESYLGKLENNYNSLREANMDEKGCEKFSLESTTEIFQ